MENNPKKEQKDEKLRTLAREIMPFLIDILPEYPHFLDGLKKKPAALTTKPVTKNASIYLPELDYLVYHAATFNLLRICGFAPEGSKHAYITPPLPKTTNIYHIPIGLYVTGGNNDPRKHCVIPTPTLKQNVTVEYTMPYALDYRLTTESRTMYMKGVYDAAKQDEATKNLSVRIIDWSNKNPDPKHLQKVIDNTRKFWETMPEDGGQSIVTKTTMEELLNGFETGLLVPGQVPWQIDSIKIYDGTIQPNTEPMHTLDKDMAATPHKISIARA